MARLQPRDEADVAHAVQDAAAARQPLAIAGHGTKNGYGRPVSAEHELSLRALSGVIFYEPAELVLSCRPATPLAEIETLVEKQGQELAFAPPDWSRLFGHTNGSGTIGGAFSVNAAGSRRIKAGAARDHLLGFRAVTGRGDVVKSGGRVMKNVTGYDLSKLACGSLGTLCILTELTFKVMPRAADEQTVLIPSNSEGEGLALLRRAAGLSLEISSLALLPPALTLAGGTRWNAALRIEGPNVSVDARLARLRHELVEGATSATLDRNASRTLWRDLGVAAPLAEQVGGALWRITTAPDQAESVVAAIRAGTDAGQYYYDWCGGLIWLVTEPTEAACSVVRRAVENRGSATLMRAPDALRSVVGAFQPQPPALAALTQRVKDSFDPLHLFNRGRMNPEF